jgi:hypothetical protein
MHQHAAETVPRPLANQPVVKVDAAQENGEVFPLSVLILKDLQAKNREVFPVFALLRAGLGIAWKEILRIRASSVKRGPRQSLPATG